MQSRALRYGTDSKEETTKQQRNGEYPISNRRNKEQTLFPFTQKKTKRVLFCALNNRNRQIHKGRGNVRCTGNVAVSKPITYVLTAFSKPAIKRL